MKKLMLAIGLFGLLPLAHAEILDNVTPVGDFVSGSPGKEIVLPFWRKLPSTKTTPVPGSTTGETRFLTNRGTIQFRVYTFNTNALLPSPPAGLFPDPTEACGIASPLYYQNQGGNNESPHFAKTSANVFAVGRNMNCQVFDTNGNRVPEDPANPNGKQKELQYSYVYMADLSNNTAWIVSSKTEQLVGINVIPDQNGNGSEELALSFYGNALRVQVLDPVIPGAVAAKQISNLRYNIGNPK